MQTHCCNPFGKKNHAPKKGLHPIDLSTAHYLMELTKKDVKPGQKLCPTCRKEMKNQKEASAVPSPSSVSDPIEEVVVSEKMNSSLTAIGLSPVKIPRLTSKIHMFMQKKETQPWLGILNEKPSMLGLGSLVRNPQRRAWDLW